MSAEGRARWQFFQADATPVALCACAAYRPIFPLCRKAQVLPPHRAFPLDSRRPPLPAACAFIHIDFAPYRRADAFEGGTRDAFFATSRFSPHFRSCPRFSPFSFTPLRRKDAEHGA
jgi:hypothetical protein